MAHRMLSILLAIIASAGQFCSVFAQPPEVKNSSIPEQTGARLPSPILTASTDLPASPDSPDKDYRDELPRFAPLSPAEALDSFEIADGFDIELVAAEPLVFDPIAFAFDSRLRLFVVEMKDYSEQATENLGCIALLEDLDGDGRMDRRSDFVKNLSWPTAIWPWRDGVLVAEPPRLTWYRDTDNDGQSDLAEDWFVGFGRENVQGMVNSLRWGVDGFIHGATSSSESHIEPLQESVAAPGLVVLRRRDFRIDPLRKTLSSEAGGGQHGLSFNRWGDKFVTSNSDHLQQIIDVDLSGVPTVIPLPSSRRSIAVDGPQAEVYRISPVEPWRIVRTRLRISGVAPGIVEGGGRAAGYFTGATGTWIFDRQAGMGNGEHDTAIVCDVGSNLVHRKQLQDLGLFWSGSRIDERSELLRSSDTWFRPVQVGDGPDGSLIIADMYREVIEHPKSLPPMIKRHLDLTSGRDRGRIWRMVPRNADYGNAKSNLVAPDQLSAPELVRRLAHPIAWQRRMASQLLIERQAAAIEPDLAQVLTDGTPEAKILAMHVASRLDLFDKTLAVRLLAGGVAESFSTASPQADPSRGFEQASVRVSQHTLRLIAENGLGRAVFNPDQATGQQNIVALERLLELDSPRLKLEVAKLVYSMPAEVRSRVLEKLFLTADEQLVQAAVANASGTKSWKVMAGLQSRMPPPKLTQWLNLLLPSWSDRLAEDSELRNWTTAMLTGESQQTFEEAANGSEQPAGMRQALWLTSLAGAEQPVAAKLLGQLTRAELARLDGAVEVLLEDAERKLLSRSESTASQELLTAPNSTLEVSRFALLRIASESLRLKFGKRWLQPQMPGAAQDAVISAVAWRLDPQLAGLLIERFATLTPIRQRDCLQALSQRPQTLRLFAEALENKAIVATQLPAQLRQRLREVSPSELATRFSKLLAPVATDRQAVVERYLQEWKTASDSGELTRTNLELDGEQLFVRSCAACHRLGLLGKDVGPPLDQLAGKSAEQLLQSILDPNREVDPKYVRYLVELNDGRVLSGLIDDESPSHIGLKSDNGQLIQVKREDVEVFRNSGRSVMPIGFEETISPSQMLILIDFLQKAIATAP